MKITITTTAHAEILRLHEAGHGPTAIGRQLGISPGRARQIIERADRREKSLFVTPT